MQVLKEVNMIHTCDGRIDDSLAAVFLEQAFGHFVRSLILGHLLAYSNNMMIYISQVGRHDYNTIDNRRTNDKHFFVTSHLLVDGLINRFSNRNLRVQKDEHMI